MSTDETPADLVLRAAGLKCLPGIMNTVLRDLGVSEAHTSLRVSEVLRAILTQSQVARRYLSMEKVKIVVADNVAGQQLDFAQLCADVRDIAGKHGHDKVDEMHFLLAAVTMRPAEAAAALQPLIDEYRRTYPSGGPPEHELLYFGLPHPDAAGQATPYAIESITERLRRYISCRFYPYSEEAYSRFNQEYPGAERLERPIDPASAAFLKYAERLKEKSDARRGFAAHWMAHCTECEGPVH